MLKVHKLTFNPFMENTYVVADATGQCVIIDPGCCNAKEQTELVNEIEAYGLQPVHLLNTHCHIDHIPGNKFVFDKYGLLPQIHPEELEVLHKAPELGEYFGFHCETSPEPKVFLTEKDRVSFGNTTFSILFTPGHSPGSISFYHEPSKIIISGDVLFYGSVGRYDLPGASGPVLFQSIEEKLMSLPDEVKVYSGHGPETTIGFERRNNPFLLNKNWR